MATNKATEKATEATTVREAEANGLETITIEVEIRGQKLELECYADIPAGAARALSTGGRKGDLFSLFTDESNYKIEDAHLTMTEVIEEIVPAWSEKTAVGED